ncbi:MAG: HNH endonuclease signature motif containing protein [bacterium]|nr:HNH endonuclease signature motif containing protein [bacterium]
MENESRNIPLPIQRETRKQCGFGCVICGSPLYEYDHIIEWSIVKEHKIENLALLCDKHHKEKTVGLLTRDQVRKYRNTPYNLNVEYSKKYDLHFEGQDFTLQFGDMTFRLENVNSTNDFLIPFLINNKQLIGFEIIDDQLYFNLVLFDKSGKLLLKIERNRLIYKIEQWDIHFVGRNLKIREGLKRIILDIDFLIPNSVKINKAYFFYDKREIIIENGTLVTKNFFLRCKNVVGFRILVAFGEYDGKVPCLARIN